MDLLERGCQQDALVGSGAVKEDEQKQGREDSIRCHDGICWRRSMHFYTKQLLAILLLVACNLEIPSLLCSSLSFF